MTPEQFDRLTDWNKAAIIVQDAIANGCELDEATRKRWIAIELRRIQEERLNGKRSYLSIGQW